MVSIFAQPIQLLIMGYADADYLKVFDDRQYTAYMLLQKQVLQ